MTNDPTIGILSPGAMGSALGRAWQAGGRRVVTTIAGRSARTRSLAVGLELLTDLADVVDCSDIVVSVGPPAEATAMAAAIADACRLRHRRPIVADVNAIAPSTVRAVAAQLAVAGCELIDGSISGPPPRPGGSTRLYLSGPAAQVLAELPAPGLSTHVIGPDIGSASAVKMCTASVYKGFSALLLLALQTAQVNGVTSTVLADLSGEFGPQVQDAAALVASAAAKSDRYPGEMRQIAMTQRAAGAEPALFEAMARVFESVALSDLAAHTPEQAAAATDLSTVLAELARAD